MLTAGLAEGKVFDLDFHAVMHGGEDPVMERHYVPRRSQRTRSVLTFFAHNLNPAVIRRRVVAAWPVGVPGLGVFA